MLVPCNPKYSPDMSPPQCDSDLPGSYVDTVDNSPLHRNQPLHILTTKKKRAEIDLWNKNL